MERSCVQLQSRQDILELTWDPLRTPPDWRFTNLTQRLSLPSAQAGSPLTGFAYHNGDYTNAFTFLYYVGPNQHIYGFVGNTAGQAVNDLTVAYGAPTVPAIGSNLTSFSDSFFHVLYVADNQHVYQLYNGSPPWQDLTAMTGNTLAAPGTAMTSFVDSLGEHVFYVGTNRHVYQLYGHNGWVNQDLTAMRGNTLAAAGTALTGFVDSYGEHVLYTGSNQHVYQLYGHNGWVNQDLTATTGNTLAAAGTALTSFADSYGEHVIYIGTNQHVYQLYTRTGWVNQDLTVMSGATNTAASGTKLTSFVVGSSEHVFYVGPNLHVYELATSSTSGGWQNSDITSRTGGQTTAQSSPLVGFTCPGTAPGYALCY